MNCFDECSHTRIKRAAVRKSPRQPFSLFYHIPQQLLLRKYNLTISIKVHPLAEECLILSAGLSILAQKCLCFLGGVYQYLKTASVDDRYVVIGILTCRQDFRDLLVTDPHSHAVTEYDAVEAVRIVVAVAAGGNLVPYRIGLAHRIVLQHVQALGIVVEFLEDVPSCLGRSCGRQCC